MMPTIAPRLLGRGPTLCDGVEWARVVDAPRRLAGDPLAVAAGRRDPAVERGRGLERDIGDALNLEVDLLARYVARLLEFKAAMAPASISAGVTRETLVQAGYLPDDRAEGTGP